MFNTLQEYSRFKVGAIVFTVLWCSYFLGLFNCLIKACPLIAAIPTIFVLSEIIRRVIEYHLGKEQVAIGSDSVLITGCDSGFGLLLAKRLADKGYSVFAGCLFPEGEGAKELNEHSSRIEIVPMDVSSDESMKTAKLQVDKKLDGLGLWAVVANAGIATQGPLEWTTMEEIQQIFNVNTFGVLRTVKTFLPLVRKTKGRFVVTTSMLANQSSPFLLPYSMSKSAIRNMVEGLNREISPLGVYFSSIEPTYYKTNIVESRNFDEFTKKYELLDEKMKSDYKGFLEGAKTALETVRTCITSTNLEEPLAAFEHAVCSKRPKPNYIVDSWSFWFCREVLERLNVEVTDFMIAHLKNLSNLRKTLGFILPRSE